MKLPSRFPEFEAALPLAGELSQTQSVEGEALGRILSFSDGVELNAPLSGRLSCRNGKLNLDLAERTRTGAPRPIDPVLAELWEAHPQLLPLPASLIFAQHRLQGSDALLEAAFQQWSVTAAGAGLRAFLKSGEELASGHVTLDEFLAGEIALEVPQGTAIARLEGAQEVWVGAEDFQHYGVFDQPLAVLGNNVDGAAKPKSPSSIELAVAGSLSPDAGSNLADKAREAGRDGIMFDGDDLLPEDHVFLRFSNGGSTEEGLFELDRFEKWSRFPARPEWHLRNWIKAGIFDQGLDDAIVMALIGRVYPQPKTEALNDTPKPGQKLLLPLPAMTHVGGKENGNFDGELGGIDRPTYAAFDIRRTRFRLRKRERANKKHEDTFHNSSWRRFDDVRYSGGVGFENYIKRVISCEFHLTWKGGGNDLGGWERITEALMVQAMASRTYVLFRWISSSKDLESPYGNDYAEQTLRDNASFQVHRVKELNNHARREERRVAIEDAMAETWGLVITHRGRLLDAEYYAGDHRESSTCGSERKEYITAIRTPYGIDCAEAQATRKYAAAFGHGRGFSQKGSRILTAKGASYIQVAHLYYNEVHLRNGWGAGDFITRPSSNERRLAENTWLISAGDGNVDDAAVTANSGDWTCTTDNGQVGKEDNANWYLSHNFMAHEFCVGSDGDPDSLAVEPALVAAVQSVRSTTGKSVRISAFDEANSQLTFSSAASGVEAAIGSLDGVSIEDLGNKTFRLTVAQ